MTAAPSPDRSQLVDLSTDELRARLPEALGLYVTAMRYPPATVQQRAPMWLTHMMRPGWRCVGVIEDDRLIGIGYGYRGASGQWWHEQVRRGLIEKGDRELVPGWLDDYFELTELHVHPEAQGRGLGEELLRRLLGKVDATNVLLSTPEGPSRAWRLYRRVGFLDVLRDYYFTGDPRPFAVLGRALPV